MKEAGRPTLQEALSYLKKAIKYSAVPGQKHLDPTLVPVEEREYFHKALMTVQSHIYKGELTKDEFEQKIGLA